MKISIQFRAPLPRQHEHRDTALLSSQIINKRAKFAGFFRNRRSGNKLFSGTNPIEIAPNKTCLRLIQSIFKKYKVNHQTMKGQWIQIKTFQQIDVSLQNTTLSFFLHSVVDDLCVVRLLLLVLFLGFPQCFISWFFNSLVPSCIMLLVTLTCSSVFFKSCIFLLSFWFSSIFTHLVSVLLDTASYFLFSL